MLFNTKQQDAHECLMLLLDIMHMDTNGMIQSERMHPKNVAADAFVKLQSPIDVQTNTDDDEWSMVNNKNVDADDVDPASEVQGLQGSECDVAGLQASDCESTTSVTDRKCLCIYVCVCVRARTTCTQHLQVSLDSFCTCVLNPTAVCCAPCVI
jgi:hypothetical protein